MVTGKAEQESVYQKNNALHVSHHRGRYSDADCVKQECARLTETAVLAVGLRIPCNLDGLHAGYDVCCYDGEEG